MDPQPVLGLAAEEHSALVDELIAGVEGVCADSEVPVRRVRNGRDEALVDALIAIGDPRAYPDLIARPPATRRICWLDAHLPPASDNDLTARLMRGIPSPEILDIAHGLSAPLPAPDARLRLLAAREHAEIERQWADGLAQLKAATGAFHELIVPSPDRAEWPSARGMRARVVPFGYHPEMGGPLVDPGEGDRDIAVLVLATEARGRGRRGRLLAEVLERIERLVQVAVVEAGAYGAEREALLARTRVVLDVHRVPDASPGLRFLLATAAGAALAAEPAVKAGALAAGRHFVAAEIDRLAEATLEILADEPRRQALVRAAQDLLRGPLAMATCLEEVLASEEELAAV